jgi:hypothetical protein
MTLMGRMKSVLMSPAVPVYALCGKPSQEAPTMVRRYARSPMPCCRQDADLPVGVWWRDACGGVENIQSQD